MGRKKGPYVYENWRNSLEKVPLAFSEEFQLFTDAQITGEITENIGPYKLINTVPITHIAGKLLPYLVLRVDWHNVGKHSYPDFRKTDFGYYHGAGAVEELAAYCSLLTGARFKAGGVIRYFDSQDPKGRPVSWAIEFNPVLIKSNIRFPIHPTCITTKNINKNFEIVKTLPSLSPEDAIALTRSARLYQDALWIIESEPALSWIMLVSAIESIAGHCEKTSSTPYELLVEFKPEIADFLDKKQPGLAKEFAPFVAETIRAQKKFIDFIMKYKPSPPTERPPEAFCISYDESDFKKLLKKIYEYRSIALHRGIPFPAPMCEHPIQIEKNPAYTEKPHGISTSAMGGVWKAEDTPILIHTFEYIVRGCLLNWWSDVADKAKAGFSS